MVASTLRFLAGCATVLAVVYGIRHVMEIRQCSREIGDLRAELLETEAAFNSRLSAARRVDDLAAELAELQKSQLEVTEELKTCEFDFKEFETTHSYLCDKLPETVDRVRKAAVGEVWPEFITSTGKTYKDLQLRSVTDDEISFLHSTGSGRIPRSDLTPEVVDRFRMGKPLPQKFRPILLPSNADAKKDPKKRSSTAATAALREQRITKLTQRHSETRERLTAAVQSGDFSIPDSETPQKQRLARLESRLAKVEWLIAELKKHPALQP